MDHLESLPAMAGTFTVIDLRTMQKAISHGLLQ